ncbi:MAG: NADH-quinone oxidoreductase subunit L [Actinomycetota bacterium]
MIAQVIDVQGSAWLIPALPLGGAAVLLLTGNRWRGSAAGWLASLLVAGSFVFSLVALLDLLSHPAEERRLILHAFDWIRVGEFGTDVALRVDPLSAVMALMVTGVGALIHIYSIDYMHGDDRYTRFFGYMNLFVFFMLILVLADNFLLLYLGWEGVGLCSYLLIGFWFERKTAADAAKKAFITTRIGDSAFLIGIIYIWLHFGSLEFDVVFRGAEGLANGTATIMALLLFAGAVGKSAQVPLHVWLPDAMEGPTPVSALIHAATMVTAGVYLVVRTHAIFEASEVALTIVALVGIVTAIYAGLSAIGQDDIKRMLAYSTISQLGFMFFGAGMGAYAAAIFLLVAHAFFKALLFLGAGSVMHALPGDETDMMRMGGIRRAMPLMATTWVVAWLAMVGIPPFSGFFAKDQVVASASQAGRTGLWIAALFGALLTAIYISRATFVAFFGERRYEGHPHDPPSRMRVALLTLAVGAALAGILGLSATTGILPRFLEPVVGAAEEAHAGPSELVLTVISVGVALAGVALAYFVYLSERIDWVALRSRLAAAKRAMERGFFVDDFYGGVLVRPAKLGSAFAAYVLDRRLIDGAANGIGKAFAAAAGVGRKVQTGLVRNYALAFLLGAVGVLWYLAVRF